MAFSSRCTRYTVPGANPSAITSLLDDPSLMWLRTCSMMPVSLTSTFVQHKRSCLYCYIAEYGYQSCNLPMEYTWCRCTLSLNTANIEWYIGPEHRSSRANCRTSECRVKAESSCITDPRASGLRLSGSVKAWVLADKARFNILYESVKAIDV